MKKYLNLKVLALALALSINCVSVFANDVALPKLDETSQQEDLLDTAGEQSLFGSFTGTIKSINKGEDKTTLLVEAGEEDQAVFVISKNTYTTSDVKLEEGAKVVGYYDTSKPMILIFPPQYNIEVLSTESVDTNIKVDKFDTELTSVDNFLKLNISVDTQIVLKDDIKMDIPKKIEEKDLKELQKNLANRKLLVYYTVTTRSIPAQTTPSKIVVLSDVIEENDEYIPDETQVKPDKDYFIVNGFKLENIDMRVSEDGYVMVPLRAICEGIGYKISWNQETQSITINEDISISIGDTSYGINADEAVILDAAPKLIENKTYVPVEFISLIANVAVN